MNHNSITQEQTPTRYATLGLIHKFRKGTSVSTTALRAQFGSGPATDCWVVRDDGGEDVVLGYGHDDRVTVPRSSISVNNTRRPL